MRGEVALWLALAAPAYAAENAPFLPAPAPIAKIVKVLAPPDFLDRSVIENFEAEAKTGVALDAYADAEDLSQRAAEQRYDVMILRGPALARRLAAGGLARELLERERCVGLGGVAELFDLAGAFGRDGLERG